MTTPHVLHRLARSARTLATRAHRDQRGAMIFMFVFFIGITIAIGAVAVDYGELVVERRDQQKSVDSIVLAGVQELPDDLVLSDQYAREWGIRNGVAGAEIINLTLDASCWSDHPKDDPAQIDSIAADISRPGTLFFLGELGFSIDVGAHAKACVGSLREAEGLRPWSISVLNSPCFEPIDDEGDLDDPYNYHELFGEECVIRLESPSSQVGSIRLGDDPGDECDESGGGAAKYVENIEEGSDAVCEIGGMVDTEPGLQVGPTLAALETLLSGDGFCDTAWPEYDLDGDGQIDTYDELLESFSAPGGLVPTPSTVFVPRTCEGSPIYDGDPSTPDTVRFVTLVLIDEFDSAQGFDTEEILGFAGFFIAGCNALGKDDVWTFYPLCDVPNGDQANTEIVGTFIQYMQLGGAGGPLSPFGTRIIALVE